MLGHFLELIGIGGLPLIFILVLLEGNPIVGSFIPGQIILIIVGFLISAFGLFNLYWTIFIAFLGGYLGDIFGFYLGKKHGFSLLDRFKINKDSLFFRSSNNFFKKYGIWSVILGREFNLTRAFMPFFAGMFKIDWKKFLIFGFFSNVLWALLSILLGYYFGFVVVNKLAFLFNFLIFVTIYFIILILVYRGFKNFRIKNYLLFRDYCFMEILILGFVVVLSVLFLFFYEFGYVQFFNEWFIFAYFPVLFYFNDFVFSGEFLLLSLDILFIFLLIKKDVKHIIIFIWGIVISFFLVLLFSLFLKKWFGFVPYLSIIFISILIFYASIIIKNFVSSKKLKFYLELILVLFLLFSFLVKFAFTSNMFLILFSFFISILISELLILLSHYEILDASLYKIHIK